MSDKASRVARIRTRERNFAVLRKAVVPVCLVYGLFIQRPKKYNFMNYLAMRRRYESDFDALFPPRATQHKTNSLFKRHAELSNGADGSRDVIGGSSFDAPMASEFIEEMNGFYVDSLVADSQCGGSVPPIQIHFRSYLIFGVGTLMLSSQSGESRRLRFVGVLGSFWKQL